MSGLHEDIYILISASTYILVYVVLVEVYKENRATYKYVVRKGLF